MPRWAESAKCSLAPRVVSSGFSWPSTKAPDFASGYPGRRILQRIKFSSWLEEAPFTTSRFGMGRGHEKLVSGPNSLRHQYFSPRIRRTPDKCSTRKSAADARHILGVWSATRPQPPAAQGFGSMPMRSLTADRIRCLQPRDHGSDRHIARRSAQSSSGFRHRRFRRRLLFGLFSVQMTCA